MLAVVTERNAYDVALENFDAAAEDGILRVGDNPFDNRRTRGYFDASEGGFTTRRRFSTCPISLV